MFQRPVKEVTAEFLAEDKYLDSIQRTVRESCVVAGMSRKEINPVMLAIEEGATNIIRHAYLYERGTIRLRIVIYRKQIVFSLIDSGRSFQPDKSGRVDLNQLVESGRKGGLGFYMINKIMDSVEYISSAGYNELRMIKRIHSSSTGSIPLLRRMFSLRVKFTVWTLLILAVIITGSYTYVSRQTFRQLHDHLDETVASLAKTAADQASGYLINRRSDVEFDELLVSYLRSNSEYLRWMVLTDSVGLTVAHSEDPRNIRKPFVPPLDVSSVIANEPVKYDHEGEELFYLKVPIRAGDYTVGMVHLAYSSEALQDRLEEVQQRTILLTLVLFGFAIIAVFLLSNYFVDPIVKITRRVRRFASGDLETELPLDGAEEFFEISRAFNELMTRVAQDRENIVAREMMAKEIEVASQIQKTLMPGKLPNLPGLELEAFYKAASVVGGDLYDIFEIDPGRYCLAVADVSGKGVPASLVMSMLRTVIQIHTSHAVSAKKTLLKVNEYLQNSIPPGMFITLMLGIYEVDSSSLNLISAGHNPMLFYSASNGQMQKLNPAGMPLGMPDTLESSFADRLEEITIELSEGDLFFMYTDGLSEASNREGKRYGMERLEMFLNSLLENDKAFTMAELKNRIVGEINEYCGLTQPDDDITFIIARSCNKRSTPDKASS